MNKNTLRSIGAVLAGLILSIILSVGIDTILEQTGVFPHIKDGLFITWQLALAATYRTLIAVLAGFTTAHLSKTNRARNVKILAIIGLIVNALGIVAGIKLGLGPVWYPIVLTILIVPAVMLGGKLKK